MTAYEESKYFIISLLIIVAPFILMLLSLVVGKWIMLLYIVPFVAVIMYVIISVISAFFESHNSQGN